MTGETLSARLCRIAEHHGDAPAVVDRGRELTYHGLARAVAAVAGRLLASGVERGQHVGIALPNGPEFATALFAVAQVGGIAVPVHPDFTATELATRLRDADASLVLSAGRLLERCRASGAAAGLSTTRVIDLGQLPAAAPDPPARAQSDDLVLCLYSSGSTGRPKRVERTHANLLFETDRLAATLALSPADRFLGVAPFSHVNGLVRSLLTPLLSGARVVTLPTFERRAAARTLADERITVFVGVPFMFTALVDGHWPVRPDFSALRLAIAASAPLPVAAGERFRRRHEVVLRQLYGTTETGTVSVNLGLGSEVHPESVGLPLDGVEVEVVSDDGTCLPPGAVGRIAVRSPAAARLYTGDTAATARTFVGDRFFPGDVGTTDTEGRLYLRGRTSTFINRGGYKISPEEVEEVLARHPKVRDVVVVGVPTASGDETLKAVIVARTECTPWELVEHCRGALADFKIPSWVEFRTDLPRSESGKVLRHRFRGAPGNPDATP